MHRKSAGAAMLLVFAALGAGCSSASSDSQVAANLKARLSSDAHLKGASLGVAVNSGVATLSGQVPSVAARYEAFKLASETRGVRKVNDSMRIQEPLSADGSRIPAGPPRLLPQPANREGAGEQASTPALPAAGPVSAETVPAMPSSRSPAASEAPASAPAAPALPFLVPRGTPLTVRMLDTVESSVNHTGEIFHGELASPISIGDRVVAPTGTDVYVRLIEARAAGRIAGHGELRIEPFRLVLNGKSYELVTGGYDVKGPGQSKRSALGIAGGAAIGGAAFQAATPTRQAVIPAQTVVTFKLEQALEIAPLARASGDAGHQPEP